MANGGAVRDTSRPTQDPGYWGFGELGLINPVTSASGARCQSAGTLVEYPCEAPLKVCTAAVWGCAGDNRKSDGTKATAIQAKRAVVLMPGA